MRMKSFLAVMLSAIIVMCAIPFTAYAESAEILEIDGERIALLSSFGKMTYDGKSRTTFRTFNEAFDALGKEGGTIVFTGTAKVGDFKDIEGRGDITIKGIGTKSSGNVLDFTGTAEAPVLEINLKGNLLLDFLNIKTDAGAFIFTNGFELETVNEFDTYHKEIYNPDGNNTMDYQNPPSIAPGQASGDVGSVVLDAGTYATLTAGAVNGHTVTGDTFIKLAGGNVDTLVTGNVAGTLNGDAKLILGVGKVNKLVAGSIGGTVNGNVITQIDGGTVTEAVIGAEAGATINGNVVVALNGGEFVGTINAGAGKVTGKKVVITGVDTVANIANGAADVIIKLDGGLCYPQFDGSTLTGYLLTDKYGIPTTSATINGSVKTSENGIYQIGNGTNEVKVETKVVISVNKNANYVAGYEDGTFLPQNNMTKAEAVTLLSRLIIDENIIKGKVTSEMKDVAPGSWYESYIGMFEKLGFLDLLTDDSGYYFEPTKNITRAQFTELIYKVATLGASGSSTKMMNVPDVDSRNVYKAAISYAMSTGIVTGYEDGTFKPDNNITRAEVVTMVNRFLGRTPTGVAGTNSFSDIASHWANGQILAACNPEGTSWTAAATNNEYVLTGTSAKDYVTALYEQGKTLSADAIRKGADVISEQMKKDILGTPNTQEIYGDKITGQIYYVSEKNGNDANDGKTPETAFKTIEGVFAGMRFPKAGTAILFERGGVYRGTISTAMNGIVYGSYGEGPKPLLMQSQKNYADPSLWEETEYENVWKLKEQLVNVGVIGFDHDLFDYSADSYDELYGRIMNVGILGFTGVQDMNADLQFFNELNGGTGKPGDLYLYSAKGNPGERFTSIEMGENKAIMSGKGNDVIIDNLAFKFTGGHGMGGAGGCKNRTVTNCVYSWLGGSVLSLDFRGDGKPVNYGNAVEIYGSCDGYVVQNCWMYQIYDTGVTHQYSDASACVQIGVRYLENLIELCHWGIEFYNANDNGKLPKEQKYTADVISRYNVVNKTGYGWGSIVRNRTTGSYAYCGSSLSTNYDWYTEYNLFNLSAGYVIYLPANSNEEPDKNIYIQHIGNHLGRLKGTYRVCDYDAPEYLAKDYGDKTALVVLIDPEVEPTPSRDLQVIPLNK